MSATYDGVPPALLPLVHQYEHAVAQLASHLTAEVPLRLAVHDHKRELARSEAMPWTEKREDGTPLLDGKNEQTRQAQALDWLHTSAYYGAQLAELHTAETEHALCLAQIEVGRERVRMARTILQAAAGTAPEGGYR